MDQQVRFALSLEDNVSATSEKMVGSQTALKGAVAGTTIAVDQQSMSFVKQVIAVSAVGRGIRSINNGLISLGLVSDETAAKLQKINAAVGMVVGSFQLVKGSIQIVKSLTAAEGLLAGVRTYNSVLKNPAMLSVVPVGLSAAAGVGGYFAGKNSQNNSTVNQTVTINPYASQSDQRAAATSLIDTMA